MSSTISHVASMQKQFPMLKQLPDLFWKGKQTIIFCFQTHVCTQVNWTDEFPAKLRQHPQHGDTWFTDEASVERVRAEVERRTAMGEEL